MGYRALNPPLGRLKKDEGLEFKASMRNMGRPYLKMGGEEGRKETALNRRHKLFSLPSQLSPRQITALPSFLFLNYGPMQGLAAVLEN